MLQDPDDGAGRGEAEEPPRQSLNLIRAALRLSSRAVYRDPAQLASQLLGRLESCKSTSVHRLLSGARAWKGASWLRPITSSLIPPHGPVAEIIEGPWDSVTAVGLSPDGQRMVWGDVQGRLFQRALQPSTYPVSLEPGDAPVTALAIPQTAQVAVAGFANGELRILELESGTTLAIQGAHKTEVVGIVWLPSLGQIVAAERGGRLGVSRFEGMSLIPLSQHTTSSITALVPTPDGRSVVSGHDDGSLRVWDLNTGPTVLFRGSVQVSALAAVPDGRLAVAWGPPVTGLEDHELESHRLSMLALPSGETIWETANGRDLGSQIGAIDVTPDAAVVITGDRYGDLRLWLATDGTGLGTLEGEPVEFSGGRFVPVQLPEKGSEPVHEGRTEDRATASRLLTRAGHGDSITGLRVTPDGHFLLSGSADGTLRVWNLSEDRGLAEPGVFDFHHVVAAAEEGIAASGSRLLDGLKVWDLRDGTELGVLEETPAIFHVDERALALSPDAALAAAALEDGTVCVWALDRDTGFFPGEILGVVRPDAEDICALGFSPDGLLLAGGSRDGTIILWTLLDGDLQEEATFHGVLPVTAVTPMAGGEYLLAGVDNGDVVAWSVEEGYEWEYFSGHKGAALAIVSDPEGSEAVSVCAGGVVLVSNLDTWTATCIHRLRGPLDAAAVAPRQRLLVSARGSSVQVHDLSGSAPITPFTAESPVVSCSIGWAGRVVVVGEVTGRGHFLQLLRTPSEPARPPFRPGK